ncbi:MAG: hypothetical protein HC904_08175 [Blastochloris sp.]|nr:hypothetical protein [Blastochloris sp.]
MGEATTIRFLDYKETIQSAKKSYIEKYKLMEGRREFTNKDRAKLPLELKRIAVLSRGLWECSQVDFIDFNNLRVSWKDGGEDLIRLNDRGDVIKVINAKEKVVGIDGIEREWTP